MFKVNNKDTKKLNKKLNINKIKRKHKMDVFQQQLLFISVQKQKSKIKVNL